MDGVGEPTMAGSLHWISKFDQENVSDKTFNGFGIGSHPQYFYRTWSPLCDPWDRLCFDHVCNTSIWSIASAALLTMNLKRLWSTSFPRIDYGSHRYKRTGDWWPDRYDWKRTVSLKVLHLCKMYQLIIDVNIAMVNQWIASSSTA